MSEFETVEVPEVERASRGNLFTPVLREMIGAFHENDGQPTGAKRYRIPADEKRPERIPHRIREAARAVDPSVSAKSRVDGDVVTFWVVAVRPRKAADSETTETAKVTVGGKAK